MIKAIDLTKRYEDGYVALDHLNLEINHGEIYCLLGANGAGKTTALNLFLSFIEPTFGVAKINDIDCNKKPLEAKKHLAYISENVKLYGNFTARQNLEFFISLAGKNDFKKDDYSMVLRRVGLPERVFEQRVKTFSKGMMQKLGVAIAMMKQSSVLLLDEPTSGLDPKAASEFVDLLLNLRNEKKAILMCTHDLFRAKEVADTIGIMKEGNLIIERTSQELQQENLEELYLRYMEVN